MVDINRIINSILCEVAPVELSGNDNDEITRCLVINVVNNSSTVTICDGNRKPCDHYSDVTVQIDAYGETAKETNELAIEASNKMTENGFKRLNGKMLSHKRFVMTFEATIDEKSKKIYQK